MNCGCTLQADNALCVCSNSASAGVCEECQNGFHSFVDAPPALEPRLRCGDLYENRETRVVYFVTFVTGNFAEMQEVNRKLTVLGPPTPWDGYQFIGRRASSAAPLVAA